MSYTNQRYMSSCLDVLNHEILNYTEATGGLDMNLKSCSDALMARQEGN